MRVKKILTSMLALTMIFGTAQAQTTPEAIIKQCPVLPLIDNLMVTNVQYAMSLQGLPFQEKVEIAHIAIKRFHDGVSALEQKGEKATEPIKAAMEADAKKNANNIARQVTGRSVAQLENMSDKELEAMANGMVSQRIADSGLGGMSLADLQALEGKSEAEIMKAMQNAKPAQAGVAPKATTAQNKEREAVERIAEQARRIRSLNELTINEAKAELENLYKRYREVLTKRGRDASEMFEGYMDHRQYTHDQYAVAQRAYETVQEQYLTACFTYWLGVVTSMQERALDIIMAMIPEAKNPPKNAAGLAAYNLAGLYFEITRMATMPPLFRGDDNTDNDK